MLLVCRKVLQKIKIRDDITLTVLNIKENQVQFVLDAPLNIIEPLEYMERLKSENNIRVKRSRRKYKILKEGIL